MSTATELAAQLRQLENELTDKIALKKKLAEDINKLRYDIRLLKRRKVIEFLSEEAQLFPQTALGNIPSHKKSVFNRRFKELAQNEEQAAFFNLPTLELVYANVSLKPREVRMFMILEAYCLDENATYETVGEAFYISRPRVGQCIVKACRIYRGGVRHLNRLMRR